MCVLEIKEGNIHLNNGELIAFIEQLRGTDRDRGGWRRVTPCSGEEKVEVPRLGKQGLTGLFRTVDILKGQGGRDYKSSVTYDSSESHKKKRNMFAQKSKLQS